jgi:hypothetical protein
MQEELSISCLLLRQLSLFSGLFKAEEFFDDCSFGCEDSLRVEFASETILVDDGMYQGNWNKNLREYIPSSIIYI